MRAMAFATTEAVFDGRIPRNVRDSDGVIRWTEYPRPYGEWERVKLTACEVERIREAELRGECVEWVRQPRPQVARRPAST